MAKAAFSKLGDQRVPKVKDLSAEYDRILTEVKKERKEYREAKEDMKLYATARKNVNMILGTKEKTDREKSI